MSQPLGVDSRVLLKRLRESQNDSVAGQQRLDKIVHLIADSMVAQVCSIYLKRDEETLELCATEGLNAEAVHKTRLRVGQGLVGRIAKTAMPISAADAPSQKGFRYMPETGEELYSSFLGVPIQRLGDILGVLVVQNREPRVYSEDEIYGLEVVAMVLAEMTELGAFVGENAAMRARHQMPYTTSGVVGQEGTAEGLAYLHEPTILVSNLVVDDVDQEKARLTTAMENVRREIDEMLEGSATSGEGREVLETYRLFSRDKGWLKRLTDGVESGLAAEVAVEKEQSATRSRMARVPDPYLRERLHDLDDLSNRLLRMLTGQGANRDVPEGAILIARNIGPGELMDYRGKITGVVLEEGSVGSHATIVARALAIPLVLQAERVAVEAVAGDSVLVDGDAGLVHLRPDDAVRTAFREKAAMQEKAQEAYAALKDKTATSKDGVTVSLWMNAGLMADLPSLPNCNADGVGLFRTELQFLIRSKMPGRSAQAEIYRNIMDSAGDKPVIFRTLDIGSDKVPASINRQEEPNPAMGWRAIRLGLDRPGLMRMQLQALLRGAAGRRLHVMFPFIAQFDEFRTARQTFLDVMDAERALGHVVGEVQVGAMLETPSLAFSPRQFFEMADFISIGGNDLKQFFFAADRENEQVRRRFDTLNVSFLSFIERIVLRCRGTNTRLSFCGEDAGRPVEAVCLAAMGIRQLSMRPASIGQVKRLVREIDLAELRSVIDGEIRRGSQSVRSAVVDWLDEQGAHYIASTAPVAPAGRIGEQMAAKE